MPSQDCIIGELRAQVDELQKQSEEQFRRIRALEAERNKAAGVGAAIIACVSLIGWLATHGAPEALRRIFP